MMAFSRVFWIEAIAEAEKERDKALAEGLRDIVRREQDYIDYCKENLKHWEE